MTVSYKGNLSAAAAIPVLAQAVATLDIPGLQGQIAGLIKAIAQVTVKPPSVGGTIAFAGKLLAAAQVAVVLPAISVTASLDAKLALLKLKLELALAIKDLLVQGSLRVYEYSGAAADFGDELGATLGGSDADGGLPSASGTFAVILLAEGGSAGETTLKILRSGA